MFNVLCGCDLYNQTEMLGFTDWHLGFPHAIAVDSRSHRTPPHTCMDSHLHSLRRDPSLTRERRGTSEPGGAAASPSPGQSR